MSTRLPTASSREDSSDRSHAGRVHADTQASAISTDLVA